MIDQRVTSPRAIHCDARPVAVFDLDGTLVRGDSFLPFLMSYACHRRRVMPFVVLPFYLALYACRIWPDWKAKEKVLIAFLRGEPKDRVAAHAERFCNRWIRRRIRPEVVERLEKHQKAGHRVVLVSASPDIYVPFVGRFFGITDVVCTMVASNGECWDGAIVGCNCKGPHKINALKQYLGQDEPPKDSYAYGDSVSDLPLLRWVNYGVLVGHGQFVELADNPRRRI